jgi:citrate lyase subunit beta / citryl-CoA lyase
VPEAGWPAVSTVTVRSYLFVPGNRPDRFAKALAAGAGAVIVDLEDAVGPADKDTARAALAAWLSPEHPVFVRVNAADTPWFSADCALASHPGVAAVLLPKAEGPEPILALGAQRRLPVYPMIETAVGLDRIGRIACAGGVSRLMFGSIDFQADLGLRLEEDELTPFRLDLVVASRLAGIGAPVDGVSTSIDDTEALRSDAQRARRLGFSGKLCIHPRQVATVDAAFAPSTDEIAWARQVVAAIEGSGGAAVAVDGKMVDRPVELRARAILRDAGQ